MPFRLFNFRYFYDRNLNDEQEQAVQKIVSGSSRPAPYLVFGPPGTGKTVTLVESIKQVRGLPVLFVGWFISLFISIFCFTAFIGRAGRLVQGRRWFRNRGVNRTLRI